MASQPGCDDDIEQSLLTTDEQGYTALHHAVMASDLATLKKLLSYADERCVNMESHDRSTALLLLCKRFTPESQTDLQTEEEILVSLLAAGANPNLPQPDPVSLPLFAALERRWWRGAELLLDAGADAKATDAEHNNRSATFFAKDNVEILARLLKGGCSYKEISDWIGGGEFTKTQVKKMVLAVHELGPEFVTENLLYETSIYIQDHESSYYLLNNFVILELDLPSFFNRIFYHGGIKDWNCKMKYIDVLTNYIFRNEEKKRELLFDLFLSCFQRCAVGGTQCAGECGWNGSPQVQTSSEMQLELLKRLLALAEHNDLPIEMWRFSKRNYRRFVESLDPAHAASGLTALNVLLYLTDLCGIPLILNLLPYFENKGFQFTASSVVAFVLNGLIQQRFERDLWNTSDNKANLHLLESPYRVLLSKITRNCCQDGQCWFRSPMLTSFCRDIIDWGSHAPSLLLLHLGVHDFTQYEDLVVGHSGDLPPAPTLISWVHRYAPRGHIKSRQRRRHSMRYAEVCQVLPSPAPLRSLQELCRLSVRAALGHCRIEEKTEGLRGLLPDSLREYLYFHSDFFIFPAPTN